jgi:hypothetical protein
VAPFSSLSLTFAPVINHFTIFFFPFAAIPSPGSRFPTPASDVDRGHDQTSHGYFLNPYDSVDLNFYPPNATFIEITTLSSSLSPLP